MTADRKLPVLALLLLAGQGGAGRAERPLFESRTIFGSDDPRFVRNAYPTVAALPNGRLFLTWSAYNSRKPRIVGAFSSDGGRSWTPPENLIDTPELGDYDPNVIVTPHEIQVYSTSTPFPQKRIDHSETWKIARKLDGSAWSKPARMPQHRRYLVGKVHVGLTLRDGTLLMPYSWDVPAEEGKPSATEGGGMTLKSGALLSRDGGETWTPGADIAADPPRTSDHAAGGVDEPAMALLANGEVYALLRTPDTWVYESRSRDGGRTWTAPRPSALAGRNAPAALWRLRGRPDVLTVWDNSTRKRWPLDAALSQDNCQTWSKPKTIANPEGLQASYPTATQAADGTLIAIWQQDQPERKRRDLWMARFNRAWVLE